MRRMALIVFFCFLIVLPVHQVNGQDDRKAAKENLVRCSITSEGSHWSRQHPPIVQITIENTADREIKFWAEYLFDLKDVAALSRKFETLGDRYYSRAGVAAKDGRLTLVPKDLKRMIRINRNTSRFVNEEVRLAKGETKQIRVDLTDHLWADGMSSFWPSDHFFALIPKGRYQLIFRVSGDDVNAVSNQVEAQVE